VQENVLPFSTSVAQSPAHPGRTAEIVSQQFHFASKIRKIFLARLGASSGWLMLT
jgi:hypothetical protein